MEAFYTKEQVITQLHIPDSTLYQMVKDGRLHPFLPRGQKRGMVFAVTEIDSLIYQIKMQATNNPQILTVEILHELDMAQVTALTNEWLGCDTWLSLATLRAWWQKNPSLFIGIRAPDGFLLGLTAVIPLAPPLIDQLCADERSLCSVTADDIHSYTTAQECACYIPFLHVAVTHHQSGRLAYLFAKDALEHYFMALGRLGIPITHVFLHEHAAHRDAMTEAILMHIHNFRAFTPREQLDYSLTGDRPLGMRVGFDQADSALVSAYYTGARDRAASLIAPDGMVTLPPLQLAFYDIPGEGIYSPVLDGHYFDPAIGKLRVIAPLLLPGRKQRGRPPNSSA